ncbi:hypothetical protein FRB99_006295 [Tulasnella sp. 403]|nr:hypothetical protein FRB99_006295 [Tulasnella sp. 403]
MALNPIVMNHSHGLQHNRSTSSSSSHSASSAVYDLYPNVSPFALNRQPQNHHRNLSTASFATQITTPADSPPAVALNGVQANHYTTGNLSQSTFKPSALARSSSYTCRRSRTGSSPYARTDDYTAPGFSSASSRSSSCSDAEQDDLAAMYFNNPSASHHPSHHSLGPLAGHGAQADYTGLFVAPPPQQHHPSTAYGIHPQQLGGHVPHATPNFVGTGVGPLESSANVGPGFGGINPSAEAQLEQLAANVRSSTTTTASDRAKQVFVQAWLTANYAPYPDGNVPRQGLYNSYRRVCDFYNIPHINTATLGKAIRLCFPAIKTRRLGVRGNSKYHYCGIRPATVAEAEFLQDFVRRTTNHSAIAASSRRGAAAAAAAAAANASSVTGGNISDEEDDEDSEASSNGAPYGDVKESYSFGGAGHHASSSGPAPLNMSSGVPHPLTLGGGLKSPTLFSMMGGDDKTPTTNTLLSAAQAQSLGGLSYGSAASQAQIRGRRGVDGTPGLGANRPGATRPGLPAAGGFVPSGGPSPLIPPAAIPVSVRSLPNFPSIDEALGMDSGAVTAPPGERPPSSADNVSAGGSPPASSPANASNTSPQHLAAIEVWRWFEDHLDGLLETVRGWRFDQFEIHMRTFWASLSGDYREVVHAPAVAALIVRADAVVYDEILEVLRSQMLSSIPPHALSSLRQLAEKMEKILLLALEGYGNTFVEPKVELGARFGHLVLRFLDMFQVTQALTSVLTNGQQLADMRRSWSEIDFESVRNQSALVCNCRHEDLVQILEVDFVQVLDGLVRNASIGGLSGTMEPVREIMNWADMCCEKLMGRGANADGGAEDKATLSSRSVLIRWGYVTSQIMRDLTIRSDPAFGAFQILKLFLDDWIALNVLRSVALSTNSVQASVEPVMQQQYLSLSPMPGQEFTGAATASSSVLPSMPSHPHHASITAQLMDHTPTTSSMLAALHDSYSTHPTGSNQATRGGQHPLPNNSFDSASFYGDVASNASSFQEFSGPFDMSFLNGNPEGSTDGHSPAAASSVSSSASVAELAAGVAAAVVTGSDAGDSPLVQRRGSDESASSNDVKAEGN